MATKPKPCGWCKKRRVCEAIQVLMRGPGNGDTTRDGLVIHELIFARGWKLCSQCRLGCKCMLEQAFKDGRA